MQRRLISIILFCYLLLVSALSNADTIYLKNGNKIEGIISKETDEFVYIQMLLGSIALSKSVVESIQRSPVEYVEKIEQKRERERKKRERKEIVCPW